MAAYSVKGSTGSKTICATLRPGSPSERFAHGVDAPFRVPLVIWTLPVLVPIATTCGSVGEIAIAVIRRCRLSDRSTLRTMSPRRRSIGTAAAKQNRAAAGSKDRESAVHTQENGPTPSFRW